MTVPIAPQSGDGEPLLFGMYAPSTTNLAALFRAYQTATLNAETVGDIGVYPTSGLPKTGYMLTTAATEIAISATSVPCQGVLVKADPDNAEDVWVGPTGITTNKTNATEGYRLQPGESVGIACRNLNTVFIRRGASTNVGVYFSASKD